LLITAASNAKKNTKRLTIEPRSVLSVYCRLKYEFSVKNVFKSKNNLILKKSTISSRLTLLAYLEVHCSIIECKNAQFRRFWISYLKNVDFASAQSSILYCSWLQRCDKRCSNIACNAAVAVCSFICQVGSSGRQRSDLCGLRIKLPLVCTGL